VGGSRESGYLPPPIARLLSRPNLLEGDGLFVARLSVEALKAAALARLEVAVPPSGAVPSSLVAVPAQGVSSARTLLLAAVRPPEALVTQAAPDLHGVPGDGVVVACALCQHSLRQTEAASVTVLREGAKEMERWREKERMRERKVKLACVVERALGLPPLPVSLPLSLLLPCPHLR